MDQVRAFLSVVWTQRFWVLSAICTIVGVICWNMAATSLDTEFTKRKKAIDGIYSTVNSIKSEPVHPNDDVNAGNLKQAVQQKQLVLNAWQELYESQRTEVLYWPKSLGEEFVQHMEGRQFGDPISSEDRGFYLNYIETRFDALLKIVDALKTVDPNAGSRAGPMGNMRGEMGGAEYGAVGAPRFGMVDDEEEDYLVQWLDQANVQQKLLFKKKPSSLKVWVTQEDLWVLETLLEVIANTNKAKGATRPDNTAVQAIVNLQIGSDAAAPSLGQVYIPLAAAGDGAGGGFGGEMGGYGRGGMGDYGRGGMGDYGRGGEMNPYGGPMGGGPMGAYGRGGEMGGEGGGDALLVTNRYVGSEGKPIEDATPESVRQGEFRKLPIRMRLMMDERWIPRILIECANAALPIEVEQLRINPDQSGVGFTGTGSGRSANPRRGLNITGNMTDVVIRGVVYIYNRPDTARLAIPGEEEPGDTLADSSI